MKIFIWKLQNKALAVKAIKKKGYHGIAKLLYVWEREGDRSTDNSGIVALLILFGEVALLESTPNQLTW